MPTVRMPRLSDSMEEGTIVRWLHEDGYEVSRGEELVEIETDKATVVYESDLAGVLRFLVEEGVTLPVGAPIAEVGGNDTGGGGSARARHVSEAATSRADVASRSPASAVNRSQVPVQAQAPVRRSATPIARRMAATAALDLERTEGSGPGGRIVKADIERALTNGAQTRTDGAALPVAELAPPGVRRRELTRTQATIARRMVQARATVPEFEVEVDVDMSACVNLRARVTELGGTRPSFNDIVLKACALALRRHPRVNGSYVDGAFELHDSINIGFAVALTDALIVPVVPNTDQLGLLALAEQTAALAMKAREGSITPAELAGGTFTVSNLGGMGVDRFTAVINPPQAAILAVGAIVQRTWGVDGRIELRPIMTLRLTCDHRILYGADAAAFLVDVRGLLQEPLGMLL
jgi:pyruvate dehydrogenase E2 component (dihydrolipoamide acetyltransferase)